MMNPTLTIPTHDATGAFTRRISEIKNIVALTQPSFHQTLLDTWEALGKPGLFQVHFPFGPVIFVADPALADRVVRDTGKVRHSPDEPPQAFDFDKSRLTRGLGGEEGPTGIYGIFAMSNMEVYGELTYREIQQYLLPAFSKQALIKYSTMMVSKAAAIAQQFPTEGTFDLVSYLNKMNLNTITQTMMSLEWDDQQDVEHLTRFMRDGAKNATTRAMIDNKPFLDMLQIFSHVFPETIPNQKAYLMDREWLYEKVINHIFAQRLQKIRAAIQNQEDFQAVDMLDHLTKAMLEAQATDSRYTDEVIAQVIQSQIASFLLAGQETTTSLETSIFRYILDPENQAIYQKIKEELHSVLGDRLPTYDDMTNLPYLRAVINYVMALYPSTFIIPRETLRTVDLGGYSIPPQTQVFPSPLLAHRLLLPDLETGGPELFLDPVTDTFYHKLLTFGKGKRACIGERFAHLATTMHCATIFQCADLTFVSADEAKSGLVPYRAAGTLNVTVNLR
jgi:cytochrome P450